MAGPSGHRQAIRDRGAVHVHRYTAACSCGWIGVHRRTFGDAMEVWRKHERSERRLRRRRRRLEPRACTSAELLPDALRSRSALTQSR